MQTVSTQNLEFDPRQPRFVATPLADLGHETAEWLWPERIPAGVVTLFCGDPEMGKSFASLDIAARISTGAAWPVLDAREPLPQNTNDDITSSDESTIADPPCAPLGSVLILSAEDNARQTIYSRIERMGGDLKKVRVLRPVRSGSSELPFSLARDLQELEYAALTMGDCKMIAVDPITSYLDGAAWTNAAMIRTVLDPLKGVAERTGAAIILINHLTKAKTAAIYRSLGSISIVGMCRVAWMFMRDSTDPERRLMLPLKNNLVAKRSSLSYRVTNGVIEWRADPYKMERADSIDFNCKERELDAIDEAMLWVYNRLKNGEEEQCKVIEQDARQAGISRTTLRRACDKLKVVSRPVSSRGTWMWSLPIPKNRSF